MTPVFGDAHAATAEILTGVVLRLDTLATQTPDAAVAVHDPPSLRTQEHVGEPAIWQSASIDTAPVPLALTAHTETTNAVTAVAE
jgi:hypothetical protein